MSAALRARIEELEEGVRQLKAAFAPKVGFPLGWRLDEREEAILSALFHTKGSYVTAEAILRLIVGFDEDAGEKTARDWVGRLRRKVEPHGVTILTRALQGYQLDPDGKAAVARALGIEPAPATAAAAPRPSHPRGWTEAEDAIVRAGYGRRSTLAVIRAELIAAGHRPRTFGSVSVRAQTLGLTNERKAPAWSAPEDAILCDLYGAGEKVTAIRLALARAGHTRNRGAIQMRAVALGVSGQRVRLWSKDELAIARAGFAAGHTYEAIGGALAARGYDRGRTAITKLAQKLGVRRGGERWTDAQLALLRQRYAEKRPQPEIAAEIGHSVSSVASMASKIGLTMRARWTERERARILSAFEAGETLDAVCRDIGRPLASVTTEARRMQLQFPPTPRRSRGERLAA